MDSNEASRSSAPQPPADAERGAVRPVTARPRAFFLVALLVFAVALAFLIPRMEYSKEWGDEGFFVNGALRILDGQVIYGDFQHNYPPGRCMILAALVSLFGQQILVARLMWCVFHAAAAGICFLVSRRMMSTPWALLAAGTLTINAVNLNKSPELFIAGLILLVAFRLLERRTSWLQAGFWLGIVAWFRHDVALFGFMIFVVVFVLQSLPGVTAGQAGRQRYAVKDRIRQVVFFCFGFAVPIVPILVYLLVHGALDEALYELTVSGYLANRLMSKEFPRLFETVSVQGIRDGLISESILYYLAILLYAAGLVLALILWFKRKAEDRLPACYVLLTALLGAELFLQVLPRTDLPHLNKAYAPAHVLAVLFVALAATSLVSAIKKKAAFKGLGLAGALVVALYAPVMHTYFNIIDPWSTVHAFKVRDLYHKIELPNGWLSVPKPVVREASKVLDPIRAFAGADNEWLLVHPAGAVFNFMFDLPNPLGYDTLRRGELRDNDPAVIAQIMQRLEATKPRFILETFETSNMELRKQLWIFMRKHGYFRVPARISDLTLNIRP